MGGQAIYSFEAKLLRIHNHITNINLTGTLMSPKMVTNCKLLQFILHSSIDCVLNAASEKTHTTRNWSMDLGRTIVPWPCKLADQSKLQILHQSRTWKPRIPLTQSFPSFNFSSSFQRISQWAKENNLPQCDNMCWGPTDEIRHNYDDEEFSCSSFSSSKYIRSCWAWWSSIFNVES